eukprot:27462_4
MASGIVMAQYPLLMAQYHQLQKNLRNKNYLLRLKLGLTWGPTMFILLKWYLSLTRQSIMHHRSPSHLCCPPTCHTKQLEPARLASDLKSDRVSIPLCPASRAPATCQRLRVGLDFSPTQRRQSSPVRQCHFHRCHNRCHKRTGHELQKSQIRIFLRFFASDMSSHRTGHDSKEKCRNQ